MGRKALTRSRARKIGRRKVFTSASKKQTSASRVNGRRALRKARGRRSTGYNNEYDGGFLGVILIVIFTFGAIANTILGSLLLIEGDTDQAIINLVIAMLSLFPFIIYFIGKLDKDGKFKKSKNSRCENSIYRVYFGGSKIVLYEKRIEIDNINQYLIKEIIEFDINMIVKVNGVTKIMSILNEISYKDMIIKSYEINITTKDGNTQIKSKIINESIKEVTVKNYLDILIKLKSEFDELKCNEEIHENKFEVKMFKQL